ncbi:MAG: COX15/CtaA family protein, partial [Maribacter sp.]|nr:COX15/CtaA family protein [Maribacter sp.]
LIFIAKEQGKLFTYDSKTTLFLIIVFGLTLVQIVLGTQVRQFVDDQIALVGENAKGLWLSNPTVSFYIHRSFSILVVLFNLYLAYRIYKLNLGLSKINWVLLILLVEVITGMVMFYWDFPFTSQALHLVLASLLFGVQFYLVLESYYGERSPKTL